MKTCLPYRKANRYRHLSCSVLPKRCRLRGALTGLLLFAGQVGAQTLILPVVSVYDGDTIKTALPLPSPLHKVSIRIAGIDAPERRGRARCDAERRRAEKAKQFLESLAAERAIMTVTNFRWDKYGGRITGSVAIRGVDVGTALIASNLAYAYAGGRRSPMLWCPFETVSGWLMEFAASTPGESATDALAAAPKIARGDFSFTEGELAVVYDVLDRQAELWRHSEVYTSFIAEIRRTATLQ